ncbi:MAG: NADH-quinone oxidoreductase subunit H [Fibrobacter sp.]|nr:NADH-quinone oxidoreductase subunit H [Fibrobacter sp.]MBR2074112.1 NADH-quinone oxidoreductase subunit H [Fibrobacter sp.]MBR2470188.1 NADH-quinone oxidoreductase subunit H [Fibrobacter sp.]
MDIIESKTWVEWLITIGKFAFCFVPVLYILLLIPMERRGAGFMQDRQGPNRSYIKIPYFGKIRLLGYVQNMCDGTKLFFKEMFAPKGANKFLYYVAPAIPFAIVFLSPCVIPWFGPMVFEWGGKTVRIAGSIVDSDVGVLLLFGLSSLSAYGAVLAGWASKSKYSFLGALRTSSMTISYEVCLGLSMMGILLLAGSFNLTDIVNWQEHHAWGIVVQPVAFFCFLIASIAETGRAPFDVAEGEPELVAGYHTEYGAMQFGLFYMGEYSHICINSFLIATLFLGGYSVPFVTTETMQAHMGGSLAILFGVLAFLALAFLHLIYRYSAKLAKRAQSNKMEILQEYKLYKLVAWVAVVVFVALGACAWLFYNPANFVVNGFAVGSLATAVGTALIHLLVLVVKSVFFCWVWIWVRWTLPRFRYDHVMHLGWKIILNIALINLVVTAVIAKLVGGN